MNTCCFKEMNKDINSTTTTSSEGSPSTKLERRRKIEDLHEQKRLKKELAEFG